MQMNFRRQVELANPNSIVNVMKNRDTLSIDLDHYTAPRAFYDIISILAKAHSSITYPLTQIPNKLKVTDELRRIELIRLANPAQYPSRISFAMKPTQRFTSTLVEKMVN